jgi:hypothetical protein
MKEMTWKESWIKEFHESAIEDSKKGRDITVNYPIGAIIKIPREEELKELTGQFVCADIRKEYVDMTYLIGLECNPKELEKKYREIERKLKEVCVELTEIGYIIVEYKDCGLEVRLGPTHDIHDRFRYDKLPCVENLKRYIESYYRHDINIGEYCPYKSRKVCEKADENCELTKRIISWEFPEYKSKRNLQNNEES